MQILFPLLALACLVPFISSGLALLLGVAVGVFGGNPYPDKTRKITPRLLSWSVMGLGAGMNLHIVLQAGLEGVGYTVCGIALTFLFGFILSRALKIEKVTSILITVGTAICGGSAIAAVAPVIRARPTEISVSLAAVFILNAVALLIFPPLGHYFGLTPEQFGHWAAIAIHDTSSVVGAALQYSPAALEIATPVKLARALWIVPIAFGAAYLFRGAEGESGKTKKPWFILGFLAAAAFFTWRTELKVYGQYIAFAAQRLLVVTLFLIGAGLNREALRAVGWKPLVLAVTLWIIAMVGTLGAILAGVIR